jgi:hypothetical protein
MYNMQSQAAAKQGWVLRHFPAAPRGPGMHSPGERAA